MINHELIFEVLTMILPQTYTFKMENTQVSNIKDGQLINLTNTTVLSFRDAGAPESRDISTGTYNVERVRLWANVYSDRGDKGVHEGNAYCTEFCNILDSVFNRNVYIYGKRINIVNCKRSSNYKKVGLTKQGINLYSINYIIEYSG